MGVEETGEKTPEAKLDKAGRAPEASRASPWSGDNRVNGKQRSLWLSLLQGNEYRKVEVQRADMLVVNFKATGDRGKEDRAPRIRFLV